MDVTLKMGQARKGGKFQSGEGGIHDETHNEGDNDDDGDDD